jgi:transposase
LDGQTQTQALPDAPSKLDQERQNANGCNGTPPIDALPAQPTDSELAQLCVDWPNLSPLERSERLKVLIPNGHSRRGLAKAIGCSEGSIRQHLKLSYLNDGEKQAFQQGTLSGKNALRKVQERKVRESLERLKLSKEAWTREVERLAKVTADWFRSLDLSQPYLEQLIGELGGGRGNIRLGEFAPYAPKPWEIPTDKAPDAVIKACRPTGDTQTMNNPDFTNYCCVWWARWSRRVMPDRKLRDTVLRAAYRLLDAQT